MSNEKFLECWEQEKQRLAALGHQWSFEDALRFSMQSAGWSGRRSAAAACPAGAAFTPS